MVTAGPLALCGNAGEAVLDQFGEGKTLGVTNSSPPVPMGTISR